jgi:hypothetical protein
MNTQQLSLFDQSPQTPQKTDKPHYKNDANNTQRLVSEEKKLIPSYFLQLIGLEDKPVLTLFIDQVANKGLKMYQKIIQWGGHNGQSLYAHAVSGVFLILSLQEILKKEGVTDEELKVLTISFCIHDLNKNYRGEARHYGDIVLKKFKLLALIIS